MSEPVLLDVSDLSKHFTVRHHLTRRVTGVVKAVDGVTFQIRRGETVALVGESGSGKTTTARCILRAMEPTTGTVRLHLEGRETDVLAASRRELRSLRAAMQVIFQDPYNSLNPRMTVMQIIAEPLVIHGVVRGRELVDRVRELVRQVGLDERYLNRYPHAFSGGQRQRIGIARALALNPTLVIADEPVSALDVSMQAQILNLLKQLQDRLKLTYLFIAHDLSVVRHFCDRVMVMYAGKLVETGTVEDLFTRPRHPYTETLLSAVPRPDPRKKSQRIVLAGEVADPSNLPTGCAFHPRCRFVEARCRDQAPALRSDGGAQPTACHRADEIDVQGVEG